MFEWHTPIPAPTSDAWKAALADYQAGRVMRLPLRDSHGDTFTMAATQHWLHVWKETPLDDTQRLAIRTACGQIAKGVLHPMFGKTRLVGEPIGCWQITVLNDITVTWIAHWNAEGVPVMLTLTHN